MKKILAACLTILLLFAMVPVSLAASPADAVTARLEQISQTEPYRGASYTAFNNQGMGSGCYAFLYAVSRELFGVGIPSQASATRLESNDYWACVAVANNNNSAVRNLLRNTQPGDLLQYKSSYTNPYHIVMVYAVNDDSISVYHSTSSEGAHISTYDWDTVVGPGGLGDFSAAGCGISAYCCTRSVLHGEIGGTTGEGPVRVSVTTGAAEEVTETSATLHGSVQSSTRVSEVGMYFGTERSSLSKLGSDAVSGTSPEMWYNTAKYGRTLEPGHFYYYQAYAIVDGQTYWGEVRSFGTNLTITMDLRFTGRDSFNIPDSQVGRQILPIDVSSGVSGGTKPYTFTASGLPDGLSISAAGVISGAPSRAAAAGTATIRVADSANLSAILTISYGAVTQAAASLDIPIHYADETISVKTGMEWAEDPSGAGKVTALWDDELPISERGSASYYLYFGNTLYFRDGGDPSAAWTRVDIPARPDAPRGVSGGAGRITGVNRTMEYTAGNGSWIACSGNTVSGLAAGTYQVRYRATTSAFASDPVSVRVTGSAAAAADWPDIYMGLVAEQDKNDAATYRLADLNGDGTPELFIFGTNEAQGDLLYTVRGSGATSQLAVSQGDFMYDAENQLIWMPYGHMDRYSDAVYRIEGGVFIREHEGKYGAYDNTNPASAYSYEWDGKAVSESEYQSLLSEAVDTRGAVNMTDGGMSAQAVMEQLRAAGADTGTTTFTDVGAGDWYRSAVEYVVEKGMMNGTSAVTFSPNETTTRAMIVTILHRMEGEPRAWGYAFSDVATSAYYADAVAWAAEQRIVNGTGSMTFSPDAPITREQLAAILYRYAQFKDYDVSASNSLTSYTDAAQISSYAAAAMRWANAEGLVTGSTGRKLNPQGNASRAEVATILMRFCENMAG